MPMFFNLFGTTNIWGSNLNNTDIGDRQSNSLDGPVANVAQTVLGNSGQDFEPPVGMKGTPDFISEALEEPGSTGAGKTAIEPSLGERLAKNGLLATLFLLIAFIFFRLKTVPSGSFKNTEVGDGQSNPAFNPSLVENVAETALYNSGQDSDPPRCMEGTRKSILEVLEGRVTTPGDTPITWLHGPAGAGKTAIARSLAERLAKKRLLLATFFFFRADALRNSPQRLVPTLAYQLCRAIPSAQPHVEAAIESNPLIFTLSMEEQLNTLIVTPMKKAAQEENWVDRDPHVILLDGLDECHGEDQQRKVLTVFSEALAEFPNQISILISSRPEHNIHSAFDMPLLKESSTKIALDETFNPDADIRWFYHAKFRLIQDTHPLKQYLPTPWPTPEVLDLLVEKASGQFIFAETVTKFTGTLRQNPLKQLNILLGVLEKHDDHPNKPFQTLDLLYFTIIGRVDKADLATALRVLGIIVTPRPPPEKGMPAPPAPEMLGQNTGIRSHSLQYIESLLCLEDGEVHRLLLDLGSLVMVVTDHSDRYVRVFHASLADFLLNQSRSGNFFIDQGLVYTDICIEYLHRPHLPASADLKYYLEKATPTSSLRDAILGLKLDSLILPPDLGGPVAINLRYLASKFQIGIQQSRFPDANYLIKSFNDKWFQALKTQVTLYWKYPASRNLILIRAALPPSLSSNDMPHLIHCLNPPLPPEVVLVDTTSLDLLRADQGLPDYLKPFQQMLKQVIITTYGPEPFTDFSVQLWDIMFHYTSEGGDPRALVGGCTLSHDLGLDSDHLSPVFPLRIGGEIKTFGGHVCALFPSMLDASSAREDLTEMLLQHRLADSPCAIPDWHATCGAQAGTLNTCEKDIAQEQALQFTSQMEINKAIARYLERAGVESDYQPTRRAR